MDGCGIMEYVNLEETLVEEALLLALAEYEQEGRSCPALRECDPKRELENLIRTLFRAGHGKALLENGKMMGYLAFGEPVEELHGRARGMFSPLGGSTFAGKDRGRLASLLLEEVSGGLVKEEIMSLAVSRYAHDEEVLKSFIFNGFGIRCSDGIMSLRHRRAYAAEANRSIVCELFGREKKKVIPLVKGLSLHMSKAPVFIPVEVSLPENEDELENMRVFAAKADGKIVGCMCVKEKAETFVAENPRMINIGIAFVKEECRNRYVAESMLSHISETFEKEGRMLLGVDCETINPAAQRFWNKHFTPYTYSSTRRIDERILKSGKGGI